MCQKCNKDGNFAVKVVSAGLEHPVQVSLEKGEYIIIPIADYKKYLSLSMNKKSWE